MTPHGSCDPVHGTVNWLMPPIPEWIANPLAPGGRRFASPAPDWSESSTPTTQRLSWTA